MKQRLLIGTVILLAGPLLAADAKDEVKNAAKKLADAGGYSWKTTIESTKDLQKAAKNAKYLSALLPLRASVRSEGKVAKDGTTHLLMTRGQNTIEAVLQDGQGAIKTEGGWKSLAEASEDDRSGQPGPGRFIARRLQNLGAPAAPAEEMAGKVKALEDEVYAGEPGWRKIHPHVWRTCPWPCARRERRQRNDPVSTEGRKESEEENVFPKPTFAAFALFCGRFSDASRAGQNIV